MKTGMPEHCRVKRSEENVEIRGDTQQDEDCEN